MMTMPMTDCFINYCYFMTESARDVRAPLPQVLYLHDQISFLIIDRPLKEQPKKLFCFFGTQTPKHTKTQHKRKNAHGLPRR